MNVSQALRSFGRCFVPALAVVALLPAPVHSQAQERQNALRKLFPGDGTTLSPESRRRASEFITGWMKAFVVLGTSGLARETMRTSAEQEVLPAIKPLEGGTTAEKSAYRAGLKVNEALAYLGTRLAEKKPFDEAELNALLRYEPGCEEDPSRLAAGVAELLKDYAQLVDPANFQKGMDSARPAAPAKQP